MSIKHAHPVQTLRNVLMFLKLILTVSHKMSFNLFCIIMSCMKVVCWALVFIFKLRFPHGVSIATILKRGITN